MVDVTGGYTRTKHITSKSSPGSFGNMRAAFYDLMQADFERREQRLSSLGLPDLDYARVRKQLDRYKRLCESTYLTEVIDTKVGYESMRVRDVLMGIFGAPSKRDEWLKRQYESVDQMHIESLTRTKTPRKPISETIADIKLIVLRDLGIK